MSSEDIEVSVCLITFNAANTIEDCLNSIMNQKYPRESYEVIVVDAGSTDETLRIIEEKFPYVKIFVEKGCTRGRARNLCIEKARGNFVAIVEADIVLPSCWLKKAVQLLRSNKKVALVGLSRKTPVKCAANHTLQKIILLYTRGPNRCLLRGDYFGRNL